jgi:DNA invertase Pin-like site-specific DNA recombinase
LCATRGFEPPRAGVFRSFCSWRPSSDAISEGGTPSVYADRELIASESMKVAIYARVSTVRQDYAMQVSELMEFANRSQWEILEYAERASGKGSSKRPVLDQLMADAALKKFDVVLVWKLDRFGRSLSHLIANIKLLDTYGIRFMCPTMGIDTDRRTPMGTFIIQLFGALAEFERELIVERVRAGVAEAKRQGKHCGRPKLIFRRDEALQLRASGLGWRTIARRVGVSAASIRRACAGVPKVS